MIRLLTPSHAVENVDPVSGCQPSAAWVPRLSTHRAPSVAAAFSAPLPWTPPAPPLNLGTRVLKWWEDGVVTLGPACLRRGSTQEMCFLASAGSIFLQRKSRLLCLFSSTETWLYLLCNRSFIFMYRQGNVLLDSPEQISVICSFPCHREKILLLHWEP